MMRRYCARQQETRSVDVGLEQPVTQRLSDRKVAYDGQRDLDCGFFAYSSGQSFVVPFDAPIPLTAAAHVVPESAAVAVILAAAGGEEFDAGVHGNEEIEKRWEAFGVEVFGGEAALSDAAVVRHAESEAAVAALVDTEGFVDAATLVPAAAEVCAGFPLLVVTATVAAVAELLREIG